MGARAGDPPPRKSDWHSSLARLERLTAREYEVFLLLREGSTNVELAEKLTVSERTIRAHLSAIMDKLELKSRLQACLASYVHTARREDVT
ncbi:response regulator transcription factor [Streptomonospora sediminis]